MCLRVYSFKIKFYFCSEIFNKNRYHLQSEKRMLTSDEMIKYYETLINNYPIISIEDGLDENDWKGWKELNKSIGNKCQIVADDLTVTNKLFLENSHFLHKLGSGTRFCDPTWLSWTRKGAKMIPWRPPKESPKRSPNGNKMTSNS